MRDALVARETLSARLHERRDDIEIEWLARATWLFRPIQHSDRPHGRRQCLDKMPDRERAIEVDRDNAYFLAAVRKVAGGSSRGLGS